MKYLIYTLLSALLLIGIAGCSKIETFKVAFGNRLLADHDMDCFMNGNYIGTVPSGATREFTVETHRLEGPTGPDTPEVAYVVFSARDKKTGKLSREFPRTIYTDRTEYIEINEWDF